MSKTVEDVRRELFEARFKNFDLCAYQDKEGDTLYEDDLTQGAWIGFNAALDAVEIQLPVFDEWPTSMATGMQSDVRAAIEQTGLGLRVK